MAWKAAAVNNKRKWTQPSCMHASGLQGRQPCCEKGNSSLMCVLYQYLWRLNAKWIVQGTYSNRTVTSFISWFYSAYVCISDQILQACMQWSMEHPSILNLHQLDNFNTIMYLISFRRFKCIQLVQWGVSIELTPFMDCSWYTTKLCPNCLQDVMHSDSVNWSNQVIAQLATVACVSFNCSGIYYGIKAYHIQ